MLCVGLAISPKRRGVRPVGPSVFDLGRLITGYLGERVADVTFRFELSTNIPKDERPLTYY